MLKFNGWWWTLIMLYLWLSKTIIPPLLSTGRKVYSYDHIQWVQHEKHATIQFFYHKNPPFHSFSLSLSLPFLLPLSLPWLWEKARLKKKIPIFSKNNFDFLFKNSSSPLKKINFHFKNLIFQFFFILPQNNSHFLFQKIMIFSQNILILPLKISDFSLSKTNIKSL